MLVVGQSGAGKTTVARQLAAQLDAPHVELDRLFHGPGWVPNPDFVAAVDAATVGERWIVDGNYSAVRHLLWSRADTVVWLDLARTTTLRRVLLRTGGRVLRRVELWNGNRERWQTVLRASHPIRWTWQTHEAHRAAYEARIADPQWSRLRVVRLRSGAAVQRWLHQL